MMAFCAMLDVDPLAIFDYDRNGYFNNFAQIRRMLQLGLEATGFLKPPLPRLSARLRLA